MHCIIQNSSNLKVNYTIFKNIFKFQQQLNVVEKVTERRPKTLLKMSSIFLNIFLKFYLFHFLFFILFDILSFRDSPDQRTPLIANLNACFVNLHVLFKTTKLLMM